MLQYVLLLYFERGDLHIRIDLGTDPWSLIQ